MPLVSFRDLMSSAEQGGYAVGYFESWNLESLLAVADAAEATRSPVILGFSGLSLPDPSRVVKDKLEPYAAMGLAVCRALSVPACLLFNESPFLRWVWQAVDVGFNMVMFSDDELDPPEQEEVVREVVGRARPAGIAVEAEMVSVPGVHGGLTEVPTNLQMTDPSAASAFVRRTGVDALAINIGQAHLHGRSELRLDLTRLTELRQAVTVPLVLHGASSVAREDLSEAVRLGIRKVNVGSTIKRAYFEGVRSASVQAGDSYDPYAVVGSGLASDVEAAGRVAMRAVVEDMMRLFGSAGKA
jgi:fructose-bisphosphate aldolase, class II